MSSSKPAPATTSQTTKTEPWQGAVPYLTGQGGVFGAAQDYFNRFKAPTPQSQEVSDYYANALKSRYSDIQRDAPILMNRIFSGEFDPSGTTTGRTAEAASAKAASAQAAQMQNASAQSYQANLLEQMKALGGANPQAAIQRMLSGQIDNPYLQQMHQANINASKRGYEDMIQSLRQQVMPDIGSQAFASGGYGGSRQGIAEGLALQQAEKNARDLSIAAMDSGNQLYGSAYESAQGRMADMANLMSGLAQSQGQFNAGQLQQGAQFNANLLQEARRGNMDAINAINQFNAANQQQANLANMEALNNMRQFNAGQLQNADQFNRNLDLQQQAARLQNLMQGIGVFEKGVGMSDNIYNQLQAIYGMPQDAYQQALNQYANVISPGAGMGGVSTSVGQVPIYNNSMGQILGGASGIAGLLGSIK